MDSGLLYIPGGIGLFLLGMLVLTDGLHALAGDRLRALLARFTRSPLTGALSGAATTAVVQSSSATTVTAVGFVGAGLLTFPQALGVVFGANLGTTVTGWLVALFGFKLQIGLAALPLVLVGVGLRMFAGGRWRDLGWALAGFSLVFIGIDALQQGMAGFEGRVTPADFPPDTLAGRLQLVLVGIVVTLVTQSSSAGVAMAMVALGAGSISLPQAAALVIGMDVGTTATAALATLGGSTAMRQTGLSHVAYNVVTGVMAFALLAPFALAVDAGWFGGGVAGDAQLALVAFHTSFNLLGVVLVLPFAGPFARLLQWLLPERTDAADELLDERLYREPAAALDAARAASVRLADGSEHLLGKLLLAPAGAGVDADAIGRLGTDLARARQYLVAVPTTARDAPGQRRVFHCLHALDHLQRLLHRLASVRPLAGQGDAPAPEPLEAHLQRPRRLLAAMLRSTADVPRSERLARVLARHHAHRRDILLQDVAAGLVDAGSAAQVLDALRWSDRVAVHLWRARHHLGSA